MARKNKRKKMEYRRRLEFDLWKYIDSGVVPQRNNRHPRISRTPRRGDIWFANLGLHTGTSVQGGCRPVLVVSNNIGNNRGNTLNVLPMTRQMKKPGMPCHAVLDPDAVSDKRQTLDVSMILTEQITTIGKEQMTNYVGRIRDEALLDAINRAVARQLGLDPRNH